MEEVPDYFIYKSILQGYDLELSGTALKNFVLKSTGCSPDKFSQILEQIVEAWTK